MDGMLDRRGVLKAAAAALVVPLAPAMAQPAPPRVVTEAAPGSPNGGAGQVTAFLRIGTDGRVTFASPVTEMGQGTHTAHAMLVADELDVPLPAVEVVAGQPEPALRLQPVNEMYSGASFGVRFWHDRIRRAAAQARAVLVQAAAERLSVQPGDLTTAEGRVTHAASGRSLTYAELAEAAARLPLPEQPPLKPAAERRLAGQPTARIDIPAKTNGRAVYGHDIRLPGMAHAVVKLSPVFGAELDGFDRASVAGLRGLIDVVPLRNGVAVVAENTWAAMEGARRVAVRFKPTPEAGLDSAEISRRLRAALDAGDAVRPKNDGDIEAALRGAARRVEATYEVPYLAHAPMETDNATVRIVPLQAGGNGHDKVEVWASTQHQDWAVRDAARVAGVPRENVTIHTPMTGGGFGRRLHTEVVEQATIVAKAIGRPVKLIWPREEEFAQSYWRPAFAARMQAALDADGRVTGLFMRAAGQSVMGDYRPALLAGPLRGNDPFSLQSVTDTRYRFGAFRAEWQRVQAAPKVWLWRSVGGSQMGYFLESFLDEVAHAAGRDPLALRRELLAHDARALNVLNTAAARAGWGTPAPAGRHRGIAYMEIYDSLCAQVAEVSVSGRDVRVHKVTVAFDCGTAINPKTVEAQVQGSVIWALSAMAGEGVTLKDGAAVQRNFDNYPILRIGSAPEVEVHIINSGERMGGAGEPGVPPTAPAVCNAIFAATGRRLRSLPLTAHDLTV